jgi:hypothetical protein
MESPRSLQNLIEFVNHVEATQRNERLFNMEATAITPEAQIPLIIPNAFARMCSFVTGRSDDMRLRAQIQPGVYSKQIQPFRDDLMIEIVERQGFGQVMKKYRAIPMSGSDPELEGNHTALANLMANDHLNMVSVDFQLFEMGFAKFRNAPASDIFLMAKLEDVFHDKLSEFGETLNLTGPDSWKGVDVEQPVDNDRIFKQVVIPASVRLIDLGDYLQNDEKFGVYNTGLGLYYRKGLWRIYPLYRDGRYEKARRVLNIYRLPENAFPTLHNTWIEDEKSITIFSTGKSTNNDDTDIDRQTHGVGQRVIAADAVMGETGRYYNKGVAVTTREDSLSEFKTVNRKSGEEWIPLDPTPTSNLGKRLTKNAENDTSVTTVPWHNSDALKIDPGMPLRFFYMRGDILVYKEGSVAGLLSKYQMDTESVQPVFREHSVITLTINSQEYVVK